MPSRRRLARRLDADRDKCRRWRRTRASKTVRARIFRNGTADRDGGPQMPPFRRLAQPAQRRKCLSIFRQCATCAPAACTGRASVGGRRQHNPDLLAADRLDRVSQRGLHRKRHCSWILPGRRTERRHIRWFSCRGASVQRSVLGVMGRANTRATAPVPRLPFLIHFMFTFALPRPTPLHHPCKDLVLAERGITAGKPALPTDWIGVIRYWSRPRRPFSGRVRAKNPFRLQRLPAGRGSVREIPDRVAFSCRRREMIIEALRQARPSHRPMGAAQGGFLRRAWLAFDGHFRTNAPGKMATPSP